MIIDEIRDHGYPITEASTSRRRAGSCERQRIVDLLRAARADRVRRARSRSSAAGERQRADRPPAADVQVRASCSSRAGCARASGSCTSLELFNFVNVEAIEPAPATRPCRASEADRIPARVTVTEGKHRKVNFGFGYGSEEKARGEIDWRHVNFFGGARTAGVFARYSSLDRGVRLNLKQPYLFNPRYAVDAERGQSWFSDEPALHADDGRRPRDVIRASSAGIEGRILGSPPDDDASRDLRERVGGLHRFRTRRWTIRRSATT